MGTTAFERQVRDNPVGGGTVLAILAATAVVVGGVVWYESSKKSSGGGGGSSPPAPAPKTIDVSASQPLISANKGDTIVVHVPTGFVPGPGSPTATGSVSVGAQTSTTVSFNVTGTGQGGISVVGSHGLVPVLIVAGVSAT